MESKGASLMTRTIKGIFLKDVVDIIEKEKGPRGIQILEDKMGDINYSALKNYPIEIDKKLNESAAEVLYGTSNSETQFEFGKTAFKVYENSAIGKTMFALMGKDIKKIALSFAKLMGTVTDGLETEVEDLGERKIVIRMKNNPYDIRHYEGIFHEAFEFFGENPHIKTKELGDEDYQYEISW